MFQNYFIRSAVQFLKIQDGSVVLREDSLLLKIKFHGLKVPNKVVRDSVRFRLHVIQCVYTFCVGLHEV